MRSIDPILLSNVNMLGAKRWDRIRDIYLPSIMGWITASLRLSLAWGLGAAVISEYLISANGMGNVIALGQANLEPFQVLGGILVVTVIALIGDRLLALMERRLNRWKSA
jgi:NitT/TauT family transport system permease protein